MSSDEDIDNASERSSHHDEEPSRDRSIDRDRSGGRKSSNYRVYVSNIPYEYKWQDLKDLFRSKVGAVQHVELFINGNGKPKGCGVVEFDDRKLVDKCLEVMQRFEVKTRTLIVKEDSAKARDKYGNVIEGPSGGRKRKRDDNRRRDNDRFDNQSQMSGRGGGGGGHAPENKWGNTYGLSAQFLESLGIDPPLCNRVFVANLSYSVDKKKLKEVFRLAGRVVGVDFALDKDGRSRGFAVVEYDHPVEAVQAVSMFNSQVLIDRRMDVRLDRANEKLKLPEGLKSIGIGLGSNGEPLRDVARNLPSNNNNASNAATGILGGVPNNAFQVASALSGLNNMVGGVSGLGGLTNASMLQANLAGVGNLASSLGLNAADLQSLAASNLVSNPLVQNSSQFGGLGNQSNLANSNVQPFSSNQNAFVGGQNQAFSNSSGGGRGFQSAFESNKLSGVGGGSAGAAGGYGAGGANGFGTGSGGAGQLLRSQAGSNVKDGIPRKILISNLPASVTFKMLSSKLNEFGDVQHLEEKGTGSMLVVYASDWQAETAIKNLDRARVDGRTIEARYFY